MILAFRSSSIKRVVCEDILILSCTKLIDELYIIAVTIVAIIKIAGNKANFVLFRTDDSNLDVTKEVTITQNYFIIPKKVITKGSYTLKLKWTENKIPYQIDYDILWK